jgi:glycosyltransferase involved in cell wall biosynthesis
VTVSDLDICDEKLGFGASDEADRTHLPDRVFLNGRFMAQPQSGVQRFSTELARQLGVIFGPRFAILAPRGAGIESARGTRIVGKLKGHLWEQFELARHVGNAYLINLGNTAPLSCSRQLLVVHDAGVFETPQAYSRRFRLWYRFLQSRLGRNGTKIVTVSSSARSGIATHLNIPEDRISIIPEGADHFDDLVADESWLRAQGLARGQFVLAVGNLAAHKNLMSLRETASALHDLGVELVVAGSLKGGAFSKAGLADLPQPARYLGRVSDEILKALYSNALCYVFPSLYEGYGLPALEAMRSGCPVVASDIPALRETCGTAALFADPRSGEGFAKTVSQLAVSDRLRAHLVERGRNHSQPFTWQRSAEQLAQIIVKDLRSPGI